MDKNHLSHSTWDCKYHVVFGSKYRTKRLYGDLRTELRDQFVKLDTLINGRIFDILAKFHFLPVLCEDCPVVSRPFGY